MPHSDKDSREPGKKGYSVSHESDSGVRVSINWEGRKPEYVILTESHAAGLKFILKDRSLSCLKVDQEVELAIKAAQFAPTHKLKTIILGVDDDGPQTGYTCRFTGMTDNDKKSAQFWKLFNRRAAYRVPPPSGRSCPKVLMTLDSKQVEGDLRDIAANGLSMWVKRNQEVTVGQEVELQFCLILSHGDLIVRATIRHRSIVRGKTIVGFELAVDTESEVLQEIMFYVTMRQIITMQEGGDSSLPE